MINSRWFFFRCSVFEGGPVENEKLIVAAWEWLESPNSFKLYFGIDLEKAESLKSENEQVQIACFSGIQVGRLGSWRMNWMKRFACFYLIRSLFK